MNSMLKSVENIQMRFAEVYVDFYYQIFIRLRIKSPVGSCMQISEQQEVFVNKSTKSLYAHKLMKNVERQVVVANMNLKTCEESDVANTCEIFLNADTFNLLTLSNSPSLFHFRLHFRINKFTASHVEVNYCAVCIALHKGRHWVKVERQMRGETEIHFKHLF